MKWFIILLTLGLFAQGAQASYSTLELRYLIYDKDGNIVEVDDISKTKEPMHQGDKGRAPASSDQEKRDSGFYYYNPRTGQLCYGQGEVTHCGW